MDLAVRRPSERCAGYVAYAMHYIPILCSGQRHHRHQPRLPQHAEQLAHLPRIVIGDLHAGDVLAGMRKWVHSHAARGHRRVRLHAHNNGLFGFWRNCPTNSETRSVGVTNIHPQSACVAKSTGGACTHEDVLYKPFAWGLAMDAITHDGPAVLSRLDIGHEC
ncbi:hypothetical protein N7475_009617 [Penicillium sp. IBT 31633x]|nr:hypothetical protein N7475_009617 [Penicillium sp. IBT 31633x]